MFSLQSSWCHILELARTIPRNKCLSWSRQKVPQFRKVVRPCSVNIYFYCYSHLIALYMRFTKRRDEKNPIAPNMRKNA